MTQEEIKNSLIMVDTNMGFQIPAIHLGQTFKGDLCYAQNRLFTIDKNNAIQEILVEYCELELLDDYLKTV